MTKIDPITAKQILEEYAARNKLLAPPTNKHIDFTKDLFDKQIAFINDPSKRKAALCSRRSGKSHATGYYLVKTAYETPNAICTYVALTRQSAKDIIWDYLLDICDRYKLQAEYNISNLSIRLPNNSVIQLSGADTPREIRKFRGKKMHLVAIDESSEFGPHLEKLVKDVITPTLIDYDGTLCMISTPGVVCGGFFYEVTTDKHPNWSVHQWHILDNIYLPRPNWKNNRKMEFEKLLKEENINKDSSLYKREYLGQWVEGGESLVYSFSYNNTFTELPPNVTYNHIFAVDFGIVDASAILIGAYSFDDSKLYILKAIKQAGLTPTAMANKIKHLYDTYSPVSITADANGIGKAFIAQITSMYELPIETAEKHEKIAYIDLLNDELKAGNILIHQEATDLIDELISYQWKDSKLKVLPDKAEDHCADALIYLFRKSLHFKGKVQQPEPKPTEEAYSNFLREKEFERVRIKQNTPWWEDEY